MEMRCELPLHRQGRSPRTASSTLTHVREPRELRWRQRRLAAGLYATEHRFRIESLPAGGVRFHQTEQIQGLFASLLGRASQRTTEADLQAKNHALKARAERMGARAPMTGEATS